MSVASRNTLDGRSAGPSLEDLGNSSVNTMDFQLKGFASVNDQGIVIVERDEHLF
jgi:hypothetical protein